VPPHLPRAAAWAARQSGPLQLPGPYALAAENPPNRFVNEAGFFRAGRKLK